MILEMWTPVIDGSCMPTSIGMKKPSWGNAVKTSFGQRWIFKMHWRQNTSELLQVWRGDVSIQRRCCSEGVCSNRHPLNPALDTFTSGSKRFASNQPESRSVLWRASSA